MSHSLDYFIFGFNLKKAVFRKRLNNLKEFHIPVRCSADPLEFSQLRPTGGCEIFGLREPPWDGSIGAESIVAVFENE